MRNEESIFKDYPESHPIMIGSDHTTMPVKRRGHWLTWVSLVIIVMVISVELSMAITMPYILKSRRQWSEEITRQRLLALMDQLRHRCQDASSAHPLDVDRETLELIELQLDELTLYLRAQVDRLNSSQLNEFEEDLRYFSTILDKLDAGTLYPTAVSIDAEKYLRLILESQDKK